MSDPWDDLDALLAHVWARLAAGARSGDDPFRTVALATCGAEGAEARMVALRRADAATGEVEVHSDARAAKVGALAADPRATILAWDPATGLQLRLRVAMTVAVADGGRWARVPAEARGNYGTDPAPGTPIPAPGAFARTPRPERFAALLGRVRALDAVSLAHAPHRRAAFDAAGGRWLAP